VKYKIAGTALAAGWAVYTYAWLRNPQLFGVALFVFAFGIAVSFWPGGSDEQS
jgi:protein-S-isoprenylcysteine O-methyltransferase Ste14